MAMTMNGQVQLAASREVVWAKLNDPEVLKSCIPGSEQLDMISDNEFQAIATVKIGPVKAKFKGRVTLSDLDPPHGYKISGPTVLGREEDADVHKQIESYGYDVHFVEGDDPMTMHKAFSDTLETCYTKIHAFQEEARAHGFTKAPRWPVIVLRSPKGWTCPKEIDGKPMEGTFRAHQVPVEDVTTNPAHLAILEQWMRSYHPEDLFDEHGRFVADLAALAPKGERRMGANPNANGGKLLVDLDLPAFTDYAIDVPKPATEHHESTRQLGKMMRDIFTRNAKQQNFRLFCPDETNSNRLGNVFEVENRTSMGNYLD